MSAGKEDIEIYDRYARKIGKTKDRSLGLADDEYFFGAHAWIVNSKNEFLIQKRAAAKKIMPNMWCIHGGAVRVGESSIDTCVREIYEELGIKVDKANAELLGEKVGPDVWRCWLDVYVIRQDIDINEIIVDKDEVSAVKWAGVDEIKKLMEQGDFFAWREVRDIFDEIVKRIRNV